MENTQQPESKSSLNEYFEKLTPSLARTDSSVGDFIIYKNDQIVSQAIALFGEYCHAEIKIMSRYLDKDSLYLDIGTNIGYHARAVNHEVGCNVMAFEPHPSHFCVAAYNCQGKNILLYHTALGNKTGSIELKNFDENTGGNYGDLTTITDDIEDVIKVPLKKLDSFNLEKCTLMKIDVEGAELDVLKGANKTIKKFRPVIFYEAINIDDWAECHEFLDTRDYRQYWVTCRTKPLGPTFKTSEANPFGDGGVSNILAVPGENEQPTDLVEVTSGESYNDMVKRLTSYKIIF
jgi:FkbM family methyltransferase